MNKLIREEALRFEGLEDLAPRSKIRHTESVMRFHAQWKRSEQHVNSFACLIECDQAGQLKVALIEHAGERWHPIDENLLFFA